MKNNIKAKSNSRNLEEIGENHYKWSIRVHYFKFIDVTCNRSRFLSMRNQVCRDRVGSDTWFEGQLFARLATSDKLVPANDRAEIAGILRGRKMNVFFPEWASVPIKSSAIFSQTCAANSLSTMKKNVISSCVVWYLSAWWTLKLHVIRSKREQAAAAKFYLISYLGRKREKTF